MWSPSCGARRAPGALAAGDAEGTGEGTGSGPSDSVKRTPEAVFVPSLVKRILKDAASLALTS